MALEWEYKWFGGELMGLGEHNNAAMRDLASQLGHRRVRHVFFAPFLLLNEERYALGTHDLDSEVRLKSLESQSKYKCKLLM